MNLSEHQCYILAYKILGFIGHYPANFACSNLAIETLEKGVKYAKS